jgi:hypothetical protein
MPESFNAPIDTLLALRDAVYQRPRADDILQLALLPALVREGRADLDLSAQAASFTQRCAGEAKRAHLADLLHPFLLFISAAIAKALEGMSAAERQDAGLIFSADFPEPVTVYEKEAGGDRPLIAAPLPAGHPLCDSVAEPYLLGGRDGAPAVILGPALPSRKPRAWYHLDRARRWTATCAAAQLTRLASVPIAELTDEQLGRLRRSERHAGQLPPRPAPYTPPPAKAGPPAWEVRCAQTLRTLPRITSVSTWVDPPAGTSLADLLAVRRLFIDVRRADLFDQEDDPEPEKYGAQSFAARVAGTERYDALADRIRTLLARLDGKISEAVERGTRFAALHCDTILAQLQSLADRLAALEKGKKR